jgi:RimJ/RimL family protein N-acetyltransferase
MHYELVTPRLKLVPCSDDHLDGLNLLNSDPEVMRYLGGRVETRADTQAVIERVKARWAACGYSWWSVFELASGEIVGAGCIQNLRRQGKDPDPSCPLEIGWRVRRDKWRQGIAMEAALAMGDFAFEQLRAPVLYAVCDPENEGSEAVMRKLGMRYRGLEEWYAQPLTTYEITPEEWSAKRGRKII